MSWSTAYLARTTTTTLRIFDSETGDPVVPDAPPEVEVRRIEVLQAGGEGAVVRLVSPGVYEFDWIPAVVGVHVVRWDYVAGGEELFEEERVRVVAEVDATSSSGSAEEEASTLPAIGVSKTCRVYENFLNSRGDPKAGVWVRFTPSREDQKIISAGYVVEEVSAESGADGTIDMYLVRGITGTIAVAGTAAVREVTIPDEAQIRLGDLMDNAADPFAVQKVPVYHPRRTTI